MKKREINIEFIRVFAIFMTVMIHVSNIYINSISKVSTEYFNTAVVYNSLSRICVPLFFMVSGIFLIKQEFKIKSYVERILKFTFILAFWSLIYFLYNNKFDFKNAKSVLANSFFNANQTSRHLWFMYAIIGIYIALPFIRVLCQNMTVSQENLFLVLWFVFSGLDVVYVPLIRSITDTNVGLSYPIPIINSSYYLGYFIAGHILYERFKNTKADSKKNLLCTACYILPTIITVTVTCFFSAKTDTVYDPMMWYRSVFIAIASFAIFILIVINGEKIKSNFILTLSKQSFGIYLIHMIFFNMIIERVEFINFNPLITIPLVTLFVYIISFVSCYIISKIPLLNKLV